VIRWFKNRISSISKSYSLVFVIMLGVTVVSSIFSIRYINSLENDFDQMFENDIKGLSYVQKAYSTLLMIESDIKDIKIFNDDKMTKISVEKINNNLAVLKSLVSDAESKFFPSAGLRLIKKSKRDIDDFTLMINDTIGSKIKNNQYDNEVITKIDAFEATLKDNFERLNRIKTTSSQKKFDGIKLQLKISLIITIILFIATLIIRIVVFLHNRKKKICDCDKE
jgi:hypothetical protein